MDRTFRVVVGFLVALLAVEVFIVAIVASAVLAVSIAVVRRLAR